MNEIKWELLQRRIFVYKDDFVSYINNEEFPALAKLKPLNALEIGILSLVVVTSLSKRRNGKGILLETAFEYFKEEYSSAQVSNVISKLLKWQYIILTVSSDPSKCKGLLGCIANKELLINKGIFLPREDFNIWDNKNLFKG